MADVATRINNKKRIVLVNYIEAEINIKLTIKF